MIHVISLGAGVQSSTMALMAAHGEIEPMPSCAIFADTAEPQSVYDWFSWLKPELEKYFPVYIVRGGDLEKDNLEVKTTKERAKVPNKRYLSLKIPVFVELDGKIGMGLRKCTADYKIRPLQKKLREMFTLKERKSGIVAVQWMGITTDEASRMRTSRDSWIEHRYPLIEMNMSREDCLRWMRDRYPGRVPPRSACYFCPYHSPQEWARLKRDEPKEFARAVEYEMQMQKLAKEQQDIVEGGPALRGVPYLTNYGVSLELIDWEKKAQTDSGQIDLFKNECEGMCGI